MSRVDEMIQRLCPDGVEYKKLEDIGTFTRGSGIQKRDFVEDGKPCIHYGQIYTRYGMTASKAISSISKTHFAKSKKALPGDVIIAITSENIEDVCTPLVWEGDAPVAISGHSCAFHTNENPRYIAYCISGELFQKQKSKFARGIKVVEAKPSDLGKAKIPVPPLEIQREIVRVLDSFTEIEAELEAELEARKAQYTHYRDRLLSRESLEKMAGNKVFSTSIESICHRICSGGTPSTKNPEYYRGGNIPWVRTQDVDYSVIDKTSAHITEKGLANSAAKWIPAGCVIVAMYGATAAKVAMNSIPVTTNQACCNLNVNEDSALSRYVYHWLACHYEDLKSLGEGSQANISAKKVKSYPVLLPPLHVQQQVVDILDRFDALTASLTDGLPAEIEARRQQYEYYRDKLLDFPREEA